MYLLGLSTEIVVLNFTRDVMYVVPFNFWKRGSHFNPTVHQTVMYEREGDSSSRASTLFATQRSVKQNNEYK